MFRSASLILATGVLGAGCGGTQVIQEALESCQERLVEVSGKCSPAQRVQPQGNCPECPKGGANGQVITRISDTDLTALIKRFGFDIRGRKPGLINFDIGGIGVVMRLSDRTNLQLYAAFISEVPPPLGVINEWNRTKRYSRAYVDSDGDAVIESDLDIKGGVTAGELVRQTVAEAIGALNQHPRFQVHPPANL